jgi:hypothetical protein
MARWLGVWLVLASWGFAEVPPLTRAQAVDILFLAETPPVGCDSGTAREQISCLIAARYVKDAAAARVAGSLYEKTGTVLGQLAEQDFDGGYRGKLHLVPRLGMASHRKHLEFAANALLDGAAWAEGPAVGRAEVELGALLEVSSVLLAASPGGAAGSLAALEAAVARAFAGRV